MDSGANPDFGRNAKGRTVLHELCYSNKNNLCIAEILLRVGANPNLYGPAADYTPMRGAAIGKHIDLVQLLINHGFDLTKLAGTKALIAVCGKGMTSICKILFDAGATDPEGVALQSAKQGGYHDVRR